MRALIVLPAYNERDNIAALIDSLLASDSEWHVLVVDDSSPDGTSALVAEAIGSCKVWQERVHQIVRPKKGGRGGAVLRGLAWGLTSPRPFDAYVEMDCDFSHDPAAVATGLGKLGGQADAVIGVRYPDGTIIGWPKGRRLLSFLANLLARTLIRWTIPDYTNGFRFYTPAAAKVLTETAQRHTGYIYLSESLTYLLLAGLRIETFPIVFRNRVRGASNTTWREIVRALAGIVAIAWSYRRARLRPKARTRP